MSGASFDSQNNSPKAPGACVFMNSKGLISQCSTKKSGHLNPFNSKFYQFCRIFQERYAHPRATIIKSVEDDGPLFDPWVFEDMWEEIGENQYLPIYGIPPEPLEPQYGISDLLASKGADLSDSVMSWVEDLVALYAALRDCTTTTQFLAICTLFIKRHMSGSLVKSAVDYLTEVVGDLDAQDSSDPQWLIVFRSLKTNWNHVVGCEAFSKISHLISMAVSVGLCKLSDVQFSIAGVRAFSISIKDKHATAIDFFSCVLDTVSFFIEGGLQCFRQGSIRPLLLSDAALSQYEDDFALCLECFELSKAGNLEKYKQLSENDLEKLLSDTLQTCDAYCKAARPGTEKNLLLKQREKLLFCTTQFRQTRLEGGLRVAPYAIGVFGASGVGKTSIAQILMTSTLQSNGFNADDDRVVTLNEGDKFMSNYRSYVNGIYIDDLGNTKAEFVDRSPAQKIIEIVNNVHAYATMAEADLKGKVAIEPKVVLITRNIKDRYAHEYSNEPVSILRRERVTLTARVRAKFATNEMLDPEKVKDFYDGNIPVIPDLWEIDVERAFPVKNQVKGKHDTIGWEFLKFDNKELKSASITDVIRYIHRDSTCHFSSQSTLVDQMKDISKKMAVCKLCRFPSEMCSCGLDPHTDSFELLPEIEAELNCRYQRQEDPVEPQDPGYQHVAAKSDAPECHEHLSYYQPLGEPPSNSAPQYAELGSKVDDFRTRVQCAVARMKAHSAACADESLDMAAVYYRNLREFDSSWISVLNLMPDCIFNTKFGSAYLDWHNYPLYEEHFNTVCYTHGTLAALALFCAVVHPIFMVCFVLIVMHGIYSVHSYRNFLTERVIRSRASVSLLFADFRANHAQFLTRSCVAMVGVYALIKVYRNYRRFIPQGNLAPTTMAEIDERDGEQNPWLGVDVTPLHTTEKSKTVTHPHLVELVKKNLCHVSYEHAGKRVTCDAFFPSSNAALLPSHMWQSDELFCTFSRKGNRVIGGHFKVLLSKKFSVTIPNTDLCLAWVPNGGSWKDLSQYFPCSPVRSCPASVLYKSEDGAVEIARTRVTPGIVRATHMTYSGLNYTLDKATFKGLCMATIVSETKAPAIVGFHLAGRTGTCVGAGGSLTLPQLQQAMQELSTREGVLLASSQGTIPTERYDTHFLESTDVHAKSPVRFLPPGANLEFYGSVKGRASYHSEVVETTISPTVSEICGIPNSWGKPQFHTWKPWQASLQHSSKPSPGMPGDLLTLAISDYKEGFLAVVRQVPDIIRQTKPLSRMEVLCGIDGRRFIDRMPARTSMGYPLGGPKNDHITLLSEEEFPTHACPAELDSRFWDEAEKMERQFLNDERSYAIFKGCLKDEPTKTHKDKVRVFQSAPIELQLLTRKYFLPVARLLSVFPLASECAVGINAHGPEWESFTQHMTRYGSDRIFAGDYSKYDLRMPCQLVLSVFRILIDIASECGYSKRDIKIMNGVATEIAYPLMAYNGDLVQLFGTNPSGQNLTVFINSLVNSLLVRCYLADLKLLPTHKSRNLISFLTYGDDIKGSVRVGFPISIKGYAEFLSRYDMVFTMPDKDSELAELMTDDAADFLKRTNKYVPELKMHLGALSEDSIFKSLHSVLRSSTLSMREQCMMNIDGAVREWFAHGRDVYELRRSQMLLIAQQHDLAHGCDDLHVSFDQRVTAFIEKHNVDVE